MNEIVAKVENLIRKSLSEKNLKPLLEPVLDIIENQDSMEGLSIVRRENELAVFQTGNGKSVIFGKIGGKSDLSFGGDGVGTLVLAFMLTSMEHRIPPPEVIQMLVELVKSVPGMDNSFKEIEA